MKKPCIVLCFLVLVANTHVDGSDATTALEMTNTRVSEIRPDDMPDEKRLAYIDALSKKTPWDKARLIRLKDAATMEEIAREWENAAGRHRPFRQQLERCASPWMIPPLAEFLYHDEKPYMRNSPNVEMGHDYGFSDATALVMLEILHRAPEIPEAVRQWATPRPRNQRPFPVPEMRRWWEENREHMENKRYDLLRPLAEPVLKSDFFPEVPAATDSIKEPALAKGPDVPTASHDAAPGEDDNPGTPNWILWTAGTLVVLAAGGLIVHRRR